jgi:thioester reductase-like protein
MGSRTVLVTGATGFIGGAAVARLLVEHPSCRVLLLVRAASEDAAAARLKRSLARFVDLAVLERRLRPCEIIRGDLTDIDSMADSRFDGVTHVLHLAAHTSFRSVLTVRRTNTDGTLLLAQRMRRAAQETYHQDPE